MLFREVFVLLIYIVKTNCLYIYTFEEKSNFMNDLYKIIRNQSLYDKNVEPPTIPLTVDVVALINSIYDISEITMTYKLDIYLQLLWVDPRLAIANDVYAKNTRGFWISPSEAESFWFPDMYFFNVIESVAPPHDDDSISHKDGVLLTNDGKINYWTRTSLTTRCEMELKNFPFDNHVCKLVFQSFLHNTDQLRFNWISATLNYDKVILPDFNFVNITHTSRDISEGDGDTYVHLILCLQFQRKYGFYFMELYIPAALIVFVAWIATMKGRESFSDLVGVLLAMLFLYFSYIAVMPKVSDFKAIDLYLLVCFVYIFIALLSPMASGYFLITPVEKVSKSGKSSMASMFALKLFGFVQRCKFILKALYPVTFVFFCLCYFVIYIYGISSNSTDLMLNKCN